MSLSTPIHKYGNICGFMKGSTESLAGPEVDLDGENPYRFDFWRVIQEQRGSVDELIPLAVNGEDVFGGGWIFFQLLAQLQDVIVHGAGRWVNVIAPDLIQ